MTAARPPKLRPPGDDKTLWRATLEAGSRMLQTRAPLEAFDIYVVGMHCARHEPHTHMEAHHFCAQVNSDVLQCAIFDCNTKDANLIGIEYIISEKLFDAPALLSPGVLRRDACTPPLSLPSPPSRSAVVRSWPGRQRL